MSTLTLPPLGWIALILVIVFCGVFATVFWAAWRVVAIVVRGFCGRRETRWIAPARSSGICPFPRCAHQNPGAARYCARCGRPMREPLREAPA